jgi:NADPH:quinone reductase-like Zn-dependent oxidoreductase
MITTARTVLFDELGGPDVLRVAEVPLGPPGPGEVRVRVEAIGLNRAEALFRSGGYYYQPSLPASRLGFEAAGTVTHTGPGVTEFAPGDPVSVVDGGDDMSAHGVYADHLNVPVRGLLPRPAGMDAVTGAAVWTTYLTAYGALLDVGRLRPGGTVLVTAASSGVGLAALQVARHVGATPIAVTRSPAKAARLTESGAAHVLAPGDDLADRVRDLTGGRGADVVFDAVAGPGLAATARAVADGGLLIVYGWLDDRPAPLPTNWPLTIHGFAVNAVTDDPARLARAHAFVEAGLRAGTLRPVVDRTFDLADVVAAHRYLESDAHAGKVVVTVHH